MLKIVFGDFRETIFGAICFYGKDRKLTKLMVPFEYRLLKYINTTQQLNIKGDCILSFDARLSSWGDYMVFESAPISETVSVDTYYF